MGDAFVRPGAGQRPLAAVSLKAYLGQQETLDWIAASVSAAGPHLGAVDLALFPVATALADGLRLASGTSIEFGAQDVSTEPSGAFTGEIVASTLAELGARYVELGHAERRRLFGDDDARIAAKAARAAEAGLTPFVCVGEIDAPAAAASAARAAIDLCWAQLEASLALVADGTPVVVAYEPVWAIGADEPAPAAYVREVAAELKRRLAASRPGSRLLYGGTAGPGVYTALAPAVDGLFLGRRAHDPAALAAVLAEMAG
ncbi:MAG: L-erythrulose 1-phosphate isomerase [Subtercola sp.]|nr:L-erythrulose 1-phosphate isomerase [Subtercola sp.]